MTTSDSTQPEDFSSLIDTQEKIPNGLIITIAVAGLLILGAYWIFTPEEEEIELSPPQALSVDPIVRAQVDQAQPSNLAESSKASEMASFEAPQAESAKPTNLNSLAAVVAPAQLSAKSSQTLPAGDRARNLIEAIRRGEQALSGQQLYDQAGELQAQGQVTDAYLLYFYAARQGHGPSAFKLAEINDPAFFQSENTLLTNPDPGQAHKWYSVAAASQVAGAEQRLRVLRRSIEADASAGDVTAQRLLLNWK
jgi:hypothetical protein